MATEELLKPRYKMIADYPGSHCDFTIGEILMLDEDDRWNGFDAINVDGDFDPANFPHLFQNLEWWEERKPEEMPEYVKINGGSNDGKIFRVREYFLLQPLPMLHSDQSEVALMTQTTPATEQEYEHLKVSA